MYKHKEYHVPFKLDESKLTGIVDAIHARLGDHIYGVLPDHFEVFFSEVDFDSLTDETSYPQKLPRKRARSDWTVPDTRGPGLCTNTCPAMAPSVVTVCFAVIQPAG